MGPSRWVRSDLPVIFIGLVAIAFTLGCLLGQGREEPPPNLSLNRTNPGSWNGRLPGPGEISLGRTNSIKGTQAIDPEKYALTIDGLVETPMRMSFKDILEYPYVERENVMYCVEGWSWSADWRGLAVRDLLADVGPRPDAKRVIFYSVDGYTSSFPIEELQASDAYLLAYMANEEYLPQEEGFPLRLVAEGKWGYKWVKWVTRIEISENEDHRGYWESRGYSDEANVS